MVRPLVTRLRGPKLVFGAGIIGEEAIEGLHQPGTSRSWERWLAESVDGSPFSQGATVKISENRCLTLLVHR